MTHEEFKAQAQEMFDGQFPNSIHMTKVKGAIFSQNPTYEDEIRDELKEWVDVTIDKYKELVAPSPNN